MGKLFAGWKKSAVWNPETGDKVQINTLSTEYSDLPYANIKNETPTGQAFAGREYPPVVGFLDSDPLAQLETWMEGNTPVCMAIYSLAGRQFVTRDKEEIHVVPGMGVDSRTGVDVHRFEWETRGENPDVIWKQNLAEGITFNANVGELVIPVEGVKWTVAADYTAGTGNLVVAAYDYSGSVVGTATQALSAGRQSVQLTTPANTWKIEIDLVDGGSAVASNVSMRADDKTEYVDY
ncbi:hypothetical protein [Gracilimonas tropica]|uniref:hypothetical protein n=1 Tax=Gracilimonas tropica TaxID=454600 RepID=UPI0003779955|nr:hypothetical protein [Gracilimonas tropica]